MEKKKYIFPSSYALDVAVKLLDGSPKSNTETVTQGQSLPLFDLDEDKEEDDF